MILKPILSHKSFPQLPKSEPMTLGAKRIPQTYFETPNSGLRSQLDSPQIFLPLALQTASSLVKKNGGTCLYILLIEIVQL